jgi:hypothetical protein
VATRKSSPTKRPPVTIETTARIVEVHSQPWPPGLQSRTRAFRPARTSSASSWSSSMVAGQMVGALFISLGASSHLLMLAVLVRRHCERTERVSGGVRHGRMRRSSTRPASPNCSPCALPARRSESLSASVPRGRQSGGFHPLGAGPRRSGSSTARIVTNIPFGVVAV